MKHKPLIFSALILLVSLGSFLLIDFSKSTGGGPITSFLTADIDTNPKENFKISNPTGNSLRDAVRVVEKDSRTKGEFSSLSLLERAIEDKRSHFQFLAKSKVNFTHSDTPVTKVISILIEETPKGPYYSLEVGANP
ncbi:MAG: hypothetical protein HKN16_12020 [Saprospiraceae bacterium]|nr:hypothetical protein [Saprospiraceae bacterium]